MRCRTKKVKCDFNQPTCSRCQSSNSTCEYSTPPPRVDGQAFDRIGDQVNDLLKKMKRIQSTYVPDNNDTTTAFATAATTEPVHWKLSVNPSSGIRIDTNISNVNELYQILLNGISQLNINHHLRTSSTSPSPLTASHYQTPKLLLLHDQQQLPKETLHHLMSSYYSSCFLAFTVIHPEEFTQKILSTTPESKTKHKLLMNSIFAWVIKHSSVFHHLNNHSDTIYFKKARQLLQKCFVKSSPVTIHALLHLYMYQLLCDEADLAYLYIGLAIRMAQDLEFNKKPANPWTLDPVQAELNKRLWWSTYWLDLTAALESNRPAMVDDSETHLDYPQKLDFEDVTAGDRIDFCVHSIQLLKIRKKIIKTLPSLSGEALLASVASFESELERWHQLAPAHLTVLHIQYHTTWIVLHQHLLSPTWITLLSWTLCQKHANMITQLLDEYANRATNWCGFFYALDGVLTSVEIHQRVALENPEDRQLAISNLLTTVSVLNKSPLTHMKKVTDILTSIHTFLFTTTSTTTSTTTATDKEERQQQQQKPQKEEPQEMAVIKLNDPNSSLVNLSITPTHLFDESVFEFNPSIDNANRKRISRDWDL